jgi:NADH:ubiquinone oxidoreductase subunit E
MNEEPSEALDLSRIDPVLDEYREQKGALIAVLQRAQDIYGYLPRPVLQKIAEGMGVALSRVYGVATFYSQFHLERRGRHILRLCDGTACHVKGTPSLLGAVKEEYGVGAGETTENYDLSVEVVYCMGSCALAPVAVVDSQVVGRMRRETLMKLLKKKAQKPVPG